MSGELTISNGKGFEATLHAFGARVLSVTLAVDGEKLEMTLPPPAGEALFDDCFYLGATAGMVCNRIGGAKFELDGETYRLEPNNGANLLHGGANGVSTHNWRIEEQSSSSVTMRLEMAPGDDGFPGNRVVLVTYQVTQDNELKITYKASTDAQSPINITNHTYFTLGEDSIEQLSIRMAASKFLARSDDGVPNGSFASSTDTGFDVSQWNKLGEMIHNNQYQQMIDEAGIDHCFVFDAQSDVVPVAQLRSDVHGITMDMYTNQPSMQLYTGRFLEGNYKPYQGVCLESQGFSDAVNHDNFPSVIVAPNQQYEHRIIYQFRKDRV